ncbi:dihydrofolate reductase family protein [Dactylosporangium sp. AC04546]|uniref:dihydrofolate reductase family protein n=1 Tax=Dactylosporangium sp. AC04546 TaxID=2862460 RepID=UPI001EDCBDF7|nr:dihydrofolate reductase family protein [Dactylosporangium sp. AC04546]WVK80036.1 dihydrofolate reductase family protein [Dactylosporangium sp. AC04546]
MRSLTYFVASTIDGFIADPGGGYDWFGFDPELVAFLRERYPETLPTHVRAALGFDDAANAAFDTVVMGSGTYRPALDAGIRDPYAHLRTHVVSRSLQGAERDPVALVRRLKAEDGLGIWLAGGGELAGALRDEIDELVVKLNPVLAGDGVPLLRGKFAADRFTLASAEPLGNGVVVLHYRR